MITKLKKNWITVLLIAALAASLVIGSWHLLHGNIRFFTDIARDFLLFEEIAQEKIVLLGPRASAIEGLFHGPLWLYMNIPAYLIGQGNPVIIGWFWLLLAVGYLLLQYKIVRQYVTQQTALIITTLNALFLSTQVFGLYNPHGAFFVMPFIIFTAAAYELKHDWRYLLAHFFLIGLAIQFQMAVGVPIMLLSLAYFFRVVHKNKLYSHLFTVFVVLLPLSTFILFDLKHDFLQTRSVLAFVTNDSSAPHTPVIERLAQRVSMLSGSAWSIFITNLAQAWNFIFPFIIFFVLFSKKLTLKATAKTVYTYSLFIMLGFFAVSLFFNGQLMFHYTLPILPTAIIVFSLSLVQLPKNVIGIVLAVICCISVAEGSVFMRTRFEDKLGQEDNWLYQSKLVRKVFDQQEESFGYFIFAPDQYAYETKAAMQYFTKQYPEKDVAVYTKQPVTYVFYSKPPENRPDISVTSWKENKLKINRPPDEVIKHDELHWIEKYYLTASESAVSPDSTINDWVHFR